MVCTARIGVRDAPDVVGGGVEDGCGDDAAIMESADAVRSAAADMVGVVLEMLGEPVHARGNVVDAPVAPVPLRMATWWDVYFDSTMAWRSCRKRRA